MEYHYVLTEPETGGAGPETHTQASQDAVDGFPTSSFEPLTDVKPEEDASGGNASNGDMEVCNEVKRNGDTDHTGGRSEKPNNVLMTEDNVVGRNSNNTVGNNDNDNMVTNDGITNKDNLINGSKNTSKLNNGDVDNEKFDISKVKNENTDEDDRYGISTENEDYNLDADTEPEDNISFDSHSKDDNNEKTSYRNLSDVSQDINEENIKAEYDPETQVIVLNKHNKFNARPKPDPSILRHDCDKCDEAFQFPYQLARHKNIKHEGKYPYSCKVCNKPFDRSSSLRDHMYVHTDSRPFECKQCDKSFKMKGNLRKHIRDMHTEIEGPKLKFQCEYCSKIFPTKERLTSHFLVHDTEKPFACNVCGKRFNRKNNLKEHVVIHSTEKNFVCPDCGMRFNRKYSLKIHARNHMEVKPYKCELCPSSFSQLHALKTHFRLHTGEKPFKCTICEKTFRQLATLQVHFKRHTGVKDFKCGICGKGFVIKRRLIEHERLHTGEKPFSCDLCPYRAATSSGLRLHKKTHVRQMERLAMQQVEGILTEGSEKAENVNKRKRNRTRKSKVPPLNISTKFLEKNPAQVNSTVDNGTEEDKDDNDESIDDVDEAEMTPVVNGEAETDVGSTEVPEGLTNESLIEIVNDIADAEFYSAESGADMEVVNDEDENSINITNAYATGNFEISDSRVQTSEVETKGKSVKKPSKVASTKSKGKENEFENLTKEVLYKHLNEFIPAIDADVLSEKVDLITKELVEIHGKPAAKKTNAVSAKKSKKKSDKNDSITGNKKTNIENYNNSLSMANSGGTMLLQSSALNPSVHIGSMSTFATQTMYEEVPLKKPIKLTSPQKTPTMKTPVNPSSNRNLIRQLLSTSTPQNTRQALALPSAITPVNRGKLSQSPFVLQNPVDENQVGRDKPFLSSTLRNMLVTRRPDHATEQTVTMATAGAFLKREHQLSTTTSPAGSSAVLRDMLSTPPKHYLVSTKNSYAAMQRSIQRQNTQTRSQNGFQGQWYTAGSAGIESDFPWVEEKDPEPLPKTNFSVSNVKIEPVSP